MKEIGLVTPTPDASSPVEKHRSFLSSINLVLWSMCDTGQLGTICLLTDGSWPSGYYIGYSSGWRISVSEILGSRFVLSYTSRTN